MKLKERHVAVHVEFRGGIEPVLFAFNHNDTEFVERIQQLAKQHNNKIGDVTNTKRSFVVYGSTEIDLYDGYPVGHYFGIFIKIVERKESGHLPWLINEATEVINGIVKADKRNGKNSEIKAKGMAYYHAHRTEFESKAALIRHMVETKVVHRSGRTLNKWLNGIK